MATTNAGDSVEFDNLYASPKITRRLSDKLLATFNDAYATGEMSSSNLRGAVVNGGQAAQERSVRLLDVIVYSDLDKVLDAMKSLLGVERSQKLGQSSSAGPSSPRLSGTLDFRFTRQAARGGYRIMRNHMDGGEAIIEAFRRLDIDYVLSSPGSEWGSVWEAFARKAEENTDGPEYLSCAHETMAVNLAIGYSLMTGRMQAVMLHTGVGLLQGSMGIDTAYRQGVPMVVVSSESLTYSEKED